MPQVQPESQMPPLLLTSHSISLTVSLYFTVSNLLLFHRVQGRKLRVGFFAFVAPMWLDQPGHFTHLKGQVIFMCVLYSWIIKICYTVMPFRNQSHNSNDSR